MKITVAYRNKFMVGILGEAETFWLVKIISRVSSTLARWHQDVCELAALLRVSPYPVVFSGVDVMVA